MRRWLPLLLLVGCSTSSPPPLAPATPAESLTVPGIENVFRVTPTLFSGGSPETDAAFVELKKLNITTIISVDGATPDVALATKHGIKYVHLPVGYDGIGTDSAYKMARVVQAATGPVYVHCHHGKHRGPAAVAAIRLCLEPGFTIADAKAWLTLAGTDAKYKGLFNLPETFKRVRPEDIAKLPSDYPAKADVRSLTRSMVAIDIHWDSIREARAKNPSAIESAAILLWEDYREMKRLPMAVAKGELFTNMVRDAETAAKELVDASKAGNEKAIQDAVAKSQNHCAKCHAKFRD